jgi:hypothetical protein
MSEELLSATEAARRLGVSTASLYDWLAQSHAGRFTLRGQQVTIDYLQGGPQGQGRIKIEVREIQRLKDLMRVRPCLPTTSRPRVQQQFFPGITARLGHPRD